MTSESFGHRQPSLCVVVPALNEVENLRPTVEMLFGCLSKTVREFEIICVNDGSTDGTAQVAEILAAEIPEVRVFHNEKNRGIGHAYIRGYQGTRCGHYVYIPGDNTWPRESCEHLFLQLGRADIITSYAVNPEIRPLGRRLLSPFYTALLNLLFKHRLHYYNGLTIYPVSFLRTNPTSTFGFGFQAEVLLRALDKGLTCFEVPLAISERAAGGSKAVTLLNIVGIGATISRLVWELRIARQFERFRAWRR